MDANGGDLTEPGSAVAPSTPQPAAQRRLASPQAARGMISRRSTSPVPRGSLGLAANKAPPSPVQRPALATSTTIVGITAPTKDDWSNEFELASGGDDEGVGNGAGGPSAKGGNSGTQGRVGSGAPTPSGRRGVPYSLSARSHSRRIVRSLDWSKIQAIHQSQFQRRNRAGTSEELQPLAVLEETGGSTKSAAAPGARDRSLSVGRTHHTDLKADRKSCGEALFESPISANEGKSIGRRTQSVGLEATSVSFRIDSTELLMKRLRAAGDSFVSTGENNENDRNASFRSCESTESGVNRRARRSYVAKAQRARIAGAATLAEAGTSNRSIMEDDEEDLAAAVGDLFDEPTIIDADAKRETVMGRFKNRILLKSRLSHEQPRPSETQSFRFHEADFPELPLSSDHGAEGPQRHQDPLHKGDQDSGDDALNVTMHEDGEEEDEQEQEKGSQGEDDDDVVLERGEVARDLHEGGGRIKVQPEEGHDVFETAEIDFASFDLNQSQATRESAGSSNAFASETDGDDEDDMSLSSESDWDAMLDDDEAAEYSTGAQGSDQVPSTLGAFQQHLEGLRNLVGSSSDELGGEQIPRRWRLTAQINDINAAPHVVRYPKPTALFSLRTRDGVRFMQEIALERWLTELVSEGDLSEMRSQTAKQLHDRDGTSAKSIRKKLGRSQPGSVSWCESYLSLLWSFFVAQQDGICAEHAVRLFRMVGNLANDTKRRLKKKSFSSAPSPTGDAAVTSRRGGAAGRSKSLDAPEEQDPSPPDASSPSGATAPWDVVLKLLMTCFDLGALALARSGAAFAAGDLSRSRGTGRDAVPGCILSMVEETKNWVSFRAPDQLRYCVDTCVMQREAEAAAHQLATCVMDPQSSANGSGFRSNSFFNPVSTSSPTMGTDAVSGEAITKPKRFRKDAGKPSRATGQTSANDGDAPAPSGPVEWQFAYEPLESSATPFLSLEARLAESVLGQLCHAYLRATASSSQNRRNFGSFPEADPVLVRATCLCDLQLLLCGMSPLTTTETNKLQDALDQLQLELEDWMTSDEIVEQQVIEIIQQGQSKHQDEGIGMCIGIVHHCYSRAGAAETELNMLECELLCNVNPAFRMERLLELYPEIPSFTVLKAKAAYTLAMYTWDEKRDAEKAEELLFECLFVLENQKHDIQQCKGSSLLSELATNAMVLYGDILVENKKYKYAIGAYESAARSYKIREHTDYKWLYRRLCSICVEHMDWDRALQYHLEILHTTKLETNLNEFVYVSERVALMLLDQRADFAQAESYLKLALSYLGTRRSPSISESTNGSAGGDGGIGFSGSLSSNSSENSTFASSSSDAHNRSLRIKLQQRLAHVLLAANRPEDAARLLSQVLGVSASISASGPISGSFGSGGAGGSVSSGFSNVAASGYGDGFNVSPYLGWASQNPAVSRDHPLNDTFSAEHLQSSASRLTVLLLLARSCLKLRWLADCTLALDQLGQEVSAGRWCDPGLKFGVSESIKWPRPRPSVAQIAELLMLLAGTSSEITMTYAVLRSRCCLYQGHSEEALEWIGETLRIAGIDPDATSSAAAGTSTSGTGSNPSASSLLRLTLGQVGRLFFYRGKILQVSRCPTILRKLDQRGLPYLVNLCRECGRQLPDQSVRHHLSVGEAFCHDRPHGYLETEPVASEGGSRECVQALWCAFEYFQLIDDALWQAKTLARIAQAELSELLKPSAPNAMSSQEREAALEKVEEPASMAIDLCADIGYAPLMLRCLLNMAELSYLKGDLLGASKFWCETSELLHTLYLTTTVPFCPPLADPGEADGLAANADTANSPSFSFGDGPVNARMQMEQALSTFMELSKNQSFATDGTSPEGSPAQPNRKGHRESSHSDEEGTIFGTRTDGAEYAFPSTRIPGIFTSPGLTARVLQHLTRLLRMALTDPAATVEFFPVSKVGDMLASWTWLADELWKQHGFCTSVMLAEHVRSPIYDEFLFAYMTAPAVATPENRPLRTNSSAPSHASGSTTGDAVKAMLASGGARGTQSGKGALKKVDEDVTGEIISRAGHLSPNLGSQKPHASFHRRNKSDSGLPPQPVATSGRTGPQIKQRERMRQLRQQLLHEDVGCKRCRISRQAELMTTEGRTNGALWSCFHRLKLLAHGEIGHSLHMEEVLSQNVDLLRSIADLTRATRFVTPAATLIFGSTKLSRESHQPRNVKLSKSPVSATSDRSHGGPSESVPFVLLCGWENRLVTVANLRSKGVEDDDLLPNTKIHELDLPSPSGGLFSRSFESAVCEEREDTMRSDPVPTLLGLWDLLRSLNTHSMFRLISNLLAEQSVLVVSSLCPVRARAIEAILGLLRPFQWPHFLLRSVPSVCAFAVGRMLFGKPFIVGVHPSCVADFVNGVHLGARCADEKPLLPAVINLDDQWAEFPSDMSRRAPILPASLQGVVLRFLQRSALEMDDLSDLPAAPFATSLAMPASSSSSSPQRQLNRRGSLATAAADGSKLVWCTSAKRRCQSFYEGMGHAMLWIARFHPYFYEASSKMFDGHRYHKSMLVEDPRGMFSQQFAHSRVFRAFLSQSESAKTRSRLRFDDALHVHIKQKAKLYRSLVGLTRGCWVWMVVLDHTLDISDEDEDLMTELGITPVSNRKGGASVFGNSAVTSASSGKASSGNQGSQWSSIFSSFGLSSTASARNLSRDAAISRVADDIQNMQVTFQNDMARVSQVPAGKHTEAPASSTAGAADTHRHAHIRRKSSSSIASGAGEGAHRRAHHRRPSDQVNMATQAAPPVAPEAFSDSSSFFQTKAKRKWIYLEEKRIRYHFRKSKTREKGSIPLDPSRTRLVIPTQHYLDDSTPKALERLQATLDRTRKVKPEELIEDPKPGRDDENWLYLVTQVGESNKARTIKLRFLDQQEEVLWTDALRVKLMNPELLVRMLETAFC